METILSNWEAIQTALFTILAVIVGLKKGKKND